MESMESRGSVDTTESIEFYEIHENLNLSKSNGCMCAEFVEKTEVILVSCSLLSIVLGP